MKTKRTNDERVSFLTQLISESKSGYENYKPHFKELQDAYLLENKVMQKLRKRNKSSIYIPKINAKVKYLITSLNDVYFNSERMADIETYINSDDTIIELWQNAIDFYSGKINMFKIFQPLFLDVLLVGTSIAKLTWHKGMPRIERVDIDSIFFDPNALNSEDVGYIVNEIYLTYNQIYERQKLGFYKKIEIEKLFDEDDEYKKIKLYDIYERKGDDTWVVSTLFESNLLRNEIDLKDGQPFIWGSMLPQLKKIDNENYVSAYGEPIMASAMPLQDEINITRNLLIDAVRSHIMPKIIVPKSMGISREDIETLGKPIYTDDPKGIQILPPPNINSSGINLQLLESELTEVTGISPQNNGAQTANNETATEISIKAQEGGRRSADYIRQYNETFIEPLFDRFAMLVFKYGEDSFFNGFQREDIPSFRFKIQTGTGAMNKEVRRAGIQASMQVFSQLYQMYMSIGDANSAYGIINASKELTKELLPILGVKNVNSLFAFENKQEIQQGETNAQY
ncbi:portal protein [Campylobacter coli]|uniref:portal protein n=2 Tax=Campylobacteraceae TaxID=72294 RepID=UPI003CF0B7D3